jgi:hypothetical protein
MPEYAVRPQRNPSLNAERLEWPSIEVKRGIRANQAKNERSNFGNDNAIKIPERTARREGRREPFIKGRLILPVRFTGLHSPEIYQ